MTGSRTPGSGARARARSGFSADPAAGVRRTIRLRGDRRSPPRPSPRGLRRSPRCGRAALCEVDDPRCFVCGHACWPGRIGMSLHIGIVGCSAEGAALCYRTICAEGARLLGPHAHPEVSLHTPSFAEYVARLDKGDTEGVGDLMLLSAGRLAAAGADFLICPDNTIHQAFAYVEPRSPRPWTAHRRRSRDGGNPQGLPASWCDRHQMAGRQRCLSADAVRARPSLRPSRCSRSDRDAPHHHG